MVSYLTTKSNSAPANIIIPNNVEIAPWTTGENVCSNDVIIRLLREPMDVTKPWNQETWTYHSEMDGWTISGVEILLFFFLLSTEFFWVTSRQMQDYFERI